MPVIFSGPSSRTASTGSHAPQMAYSRPINRLSRSKSEFIDRLLFLHDLFLAGLGQFGGLGLVGLGELLDFVLGLVAVVFGKIFVLLAGVGLLVAVAADVADGDLGLFVNSFTRPTILRRTSVNKGGTFKRISRPSFCGLKPRSLVWMAFSMSLNVPGSYGRMTIWLGSGRPPRPLV